MAIMILWKLFAPFAPVGCGNLTCRSQDPISIAGKKVVQGIIFATLWMEMSFFFPLTPD